MKSTASILFSFFVLCQVQAQLPNTDIYLFDFKMVNENMILNNGKYLSGFNPKGYNNQPSFINDDEILISSNHYDPAQTDVIKLNHKLKKLTRVTATPQGEYSPTLLPNRREFSVIREVLGGDVNQILWKYPVSQNNKGKQALADENTVGYHSWINGSEVATFLVGDPHKLFVHNLIDDSRQLIANRPGRSLISRDGMLYYVQKATPETWYIKVYDPLTGDSEIISKTVPGAEDMAMLSNGSIIMTSGSQLHILDPDTSTQWTQIADLSVFGLNNLSRLAVRRNKIILVNAL